MCINTFNIIMVLMSICIIFFCIAIIPHKNILTLLGSDSQTNIYKKGEFYHNFTNSDSDNLINSGTNLMMHIPGICYRYMYANKIRSTALKRTQLFATEKRFQVPKRIL